jgi:glycosyltransferase involved in cell wall biosynthesis
MRPVKRLHILGTRGIPARHGGFETFAERLALHLAGRGWEVTVYCQEAGSGAIRTDRWQGVDRVLVPVPGGGVAGTVLFDWRSALRARPQPGVVLTLGYNTAVFFVVHRLRRTTHLVNMDGIEWQRAKWSALARAWLWLNERAACRLADHLIADNPGIARHLAARTPAERITTIPYGADAVVEADPGVPASLGLEPRRYLTVIARAEPENSILEIVRAFARRRRGMRLAVIGAYDARVPYQRRVMDAASDEVVFVGPEYGPERLSALRYHALLHVHGHRVGGTNPSLVEALGAGNAVLAYDNPFNRWVAGDGALYFVDEVSCAAQLDRLLADEPLRAALARASVARHRGEFTWSAVLTRYEALLDAWAAPVGAPAADARHRPS